MEEWFFVDHLDVERLLSEWRWRYPQTMSLVARNAFGDLFLRDDAGAIFRLEVAVGKLTQISNSETEFRKMADAADNRQEWFAEADFQAALKRGLNPNSSQCIGFTLPLVFGESGSLNTAYLVDLYEHVSFLGNLNQQISGPPDASNERVEAKPPEAPSQ